MKQYTLRIGNSGQVVKDVQKALHLTIDGKFGPKTDAAVKDFQRARGLTVDGIVGSKTFEALGVPQPIPGIDVSHWNGPIDWEKVKADGCAFAWAKVDGRLHENRPGAQKAKVPLGVYHFADVTKDVAESATGFANRVYKLVPGELVPMLDLENTYGKGSMWISNWAQAWLSIVAQRLGRMPVLYTNNSVLTMLRDAGFVPPPGCLLWIARYSGREDDPDLVIRPWEKWGLWQWSDHGKVDGISEDVDLDWMAGGVPMLKDLMVKVPR